MVVLGNTISGFRTRDTHSFSRVLERKFKAHMNKKHAYVFFSLPLLFPTPHLSLSHLPSSSSQNFVLISLLLSPPALVSGSPLCITFSFSACPPLSLSVCLHAHILQDIIVHTQQALGHSAGLCS